ncbi:hypothetical protein ANO11243_065280 [Dothideomycetidae sp. 11243]|nr:hypothetical protein ANO11243_065280 [fungal sp. No.11243]
MHTAMINRSIRAIKAELEFLTDASVITPQTLSHILEQIPAQTALHAPLSVGAVPTAAAVPGAPQPPTNAMQNTHLTDNNLAPWQRQQQQQQPSPVPSPAPPPSYGQPPPSTMPPLCAAIALYGYKGEDEGDLTLQPNDFIEVTEYMNAEWWKGRSTRTGAVGIFPRSYVRVEEQKHFPPQQEQQQSGYGNMPLETSGMGNGTGPVPSKNQEMGKKFGKKLGNAAIFGAGASIGSHIVNGIL